MNQCEDFLSEQYRFLQDELPRWQGDAVTAEIDLQFLLPYGNACDDSLAWIENEQHTSLVLDDVSFECLTEATEVDYGEWQVTFVIRPRPHCELADEVNVRVNGESHPTRYEDGVLTLSFTYTDYYYRPAILDGVDFGPVFDYDYYVDSNPDLYGEDRETILRHFRDEGMPAGEMGNEFFDPIMIYDSLPNQGARYGANWPVYYELFNHSPGLWMAQLDFTYQPELEKAE